MLNHIEINNFKSIKNLAIDCKRINLFIGKPGTGKSNILEALGFLSWIYHDGDIRGYIRYKDFYNLFYDNITDNPISIKGLLDEKTFALTVTPEANRFVMKLNAGTHQDHYASASINGVEQNFNSRSSELENFKYIKYYKYKDIPQGSFLNMNYPTLSTPNGDNMFIVVERNKKIREDMKIFFKDFGYRLNQDQEENIRLKPKKKVKI